MLPGVGDEIVYFVKVSIFHFVSAGGTTRDFEARSV